MSNLTKLQKQFIKSLSVKKYRDEAQLFTVEGERSVNELIKSGSAIHSIYYTDNYSGIKIPKTINAVIITNVEMEQLSGFKSASTVLALVETPKYNFDPDTPRKELVVFCDNVQDPGNMGTIIRLADWFGIKHIVRSPNSADFFSPKTVQSSMGSFAGIKFYTLDHKVLFSSINYPVYGTFLEGSPISEIKLERNGIIILGNEGNGISDDVEKYTTQKIFIPPYNKEAVIAESLNVSMAAAIVFSNFI